MDQDKVLQAADDQLNFLDRMTALHQKRLADSIQALEKRIVDRLTILQTDDKGSLIGPKTNLVQAQKVHSDLTQLFDEEYGESARDTVEEYSKSLPVIQQQYADLGEAAKFTGVDKQMINTLKTRDLAEYAGFGLQAQDKIAAALYDHVVAQSSFSSLVTAIAGALTGHKDARGKPMANYARQMANDGIMNFHNAVNLKKADDLGFTHFLYVGNIIADSRDFCVKRAGNVYTKEQIDSWTGPWKGKSGPAFTHRGGYNCRHHWQPVRKEWIPEGGIEVQSHFDRAGVMPVSKLSAAITGSPKFKAYQAYQKSLLIDKKPLSVSEIVKQTGGNKAATTAWLSHWEKGFDLPQGWQSVVRDLEAEVGGFERAVVDKITPPKTAKGIKDIYSELDEAFYKLDGVQQQIAKVAGRPVNSLSGSGISQVSLAKGKYTDPLERLAEDGARDRHQGKWYDIDTVQVQEVMKELLPLATEHEAILFRLAESASTIIETDVSLEPLGFKSVSNAKTAKSLYSQATAKRKAFEGSLKKYGISSTWQKSQFGGGIGKFEYNFREGLVKAGVDETPIQKVQRLYHARLAEHIRIEKQARYQWLNLADEKTYLAERRKVTDGLVRIKAGGNKEWKTPEGKKKIKLEKQTRTSVALSKVPIDLLEAMDEAGYHIDFYSKAGRSFCREGEGLCAIFETYPKKMGGGKVGWDVISHEWGHAIDSFFDPNFHSSGGTWGGIKAQNFVSETNGISYRGWFNKQHTGKMGDYSNGDGKYFDNNWLDNYEGRFYPGSGGVGEEWFAMNFQRYSYQSYLDNPIPFEGSKEVSGHLRSTIRTWQRSKEMYPELASFMERFFSGSRTVLY